MYIFLLRYARYATFIVKHPYILLVLIAVLMILSGSFSFIPQLGAQPLPDFSKPFKVRLSKYGIQMIRKLRQNVWYFSNHSTSEMVYEERNPKLALRELVKSS
jgi:hypothetical protein